MKGSVQDIERLAVVNAGTSPLKLYTLYSPPNHRDGVVHHTRADAEADDEHFDGKTTE
jgi:hypothetical protein